jgi:hypothetical protein
MVGTNLLLVRNDRPYTQHFIENKWAIKVTYPVIVDETSQVFLASGQAYAIALRYGTGVRRDCKDCYDCDRPKSDSRRDRYHGS